ncbi:spore germination protein [Paenibacillus sp. CGMCC 1.16610]|uniref:Spore gernimation protein GerA n=1 Tax=Paenibacillus anseongense TaxID=2682845 RepID=A0ABW9UI60_9BACL|nr:MULTISPECIES: spore germination protein [Paenibacillus]MBA2941028.1 spore germination protein [Paenibacillus sp. CGMCC 1.16610]MVQ39849.1 spore gernimation protein GerA [Paenibacillus anseongense]
MPNAHVDMIAYLKEKFKHGTDFVIEELKDESGTSFVVFYLASLVDSTQIAIHLKRLRWDKPETYTSVEGKSNLSKEELVHEILGNRVVVVHAKGNMSLQMKTRNVSRSIDSPQSESSIESSEDSFTESAITNLGILRTHLQSSNLVLSTVALGNIRKRYISIGYMRDTDGESLAQEVNALLSSTDMDILSIHDLAKALGQRRWGPFSMFTSTQLPEQTASFLMRGRIVLFLDQHPYALITPPYIVDLFAAYYDRNIPGLLAVLNVALRLIGILVALIVPGLYVALVSINPELLDINLALAVARSREGVPYPALIEMLLMSIIIDIMVAASIRLPKSIGPTITMVGGIILGQAAVQAKLVSNLLLIVLAATIISNFNMIGIQNSLVIRLFKYLNVVLGAILGLVGILTGLVFFIFYMARITTFRRPYLRIPSESAGEDYE